MCLINLPHRKFCRAVAQLTKPESILEVGVRDGDSLLALVNGAGSQLHNVVGCDTWGLYHGGTGRGSPKHVDVQLRKVFPGKIQWHSVGSAAMWSLLVENFDIVHIDADHSIEGALNDLTEGWKHTVKVMIAHDIFMSSVWTAVSEWLSKHPQQIKGTNISAMDTGSIAIWKT